MQQSRTTDRTTVAIQAGGRSSRMGRDKAHVQLDGRPLIEHVLAQVNGLTDDILITTNDQASLAHLELPMASDAEPGAGALPGLRTALAAATGEHVLVVAVDMPFLRRKLLAYLLALSPYADVVVPMWDGRLQPTCAVYKREVCLGAVDAALAAGKQRMIGWFDDVEVVVVDSAEIIEFDPDGLSFFNTNTEEELATAEDMLKTMDLD